MSKLTFMGAGSATFVKNIVGDVLLTPVFRDAEIALYDIDGRRLAESTRMIGTLNDNINGGRARISTHLGPRRRKAALDGADYVVNAIQVGGYRPATVIDFEVPKRYGLRQTIGDTLGIGGIFRALRTIPVVLDFARDMESVCPEAWFLNYTNPMAMVTGALLRGSGIRGVGLCHSVQSCAADLLSGVGLSGKVKQPRWRIAGINHQAWLLEIRDGRRDLYPEIKSRALAMLAEARRPGGVPYRDMVRHLLMLEFGYFLTESSEHSAEYLPYFIKSRFPGLIREFAIPLDEYPRRCEETLRQWKTLSRELLNDRTLSHTRSVEYGSRIMEAIETGIPYSFGGNVLNAGLITNLPARAIVEVPCLADAGGVRGSGVGDLPEVCAAVNRTGINVQLLTVEAALTRNRDCIYQAAMLDPHTAAELPIDQIRALCDELIAAHGRMLPVYRGTRIRPHRERGRPLRSLAPLHVIGPFENAGPDGQSRGLGPVFPPEERIELSARYPGKGGRMIRWKRIPEAKLRADGFVDLIRHIGRVDHAVAYAAITVTSPRARVMRLYTGSDDGLAVWLNGREVFRLDQPRGALPRQDTIRLRLRRGRNDLLLKISQERGLWGFFAQVAVPERVACART